MGVFGFETFIKEGNNLIQKNTNLVNEAKSLPKEKDPILIIDFSTLLGSMLRNTTFGSPMGYLDNISVLNKELEKFVNKLNVHGIKPIWYIKGSSQEKMKEKDYQNERGLRVKLQRTKLKNIEDLFDYFNNNELMFEKWRSLPALGNIKKHFVQYLK